MTETESKEDRGLIELHNLTKEGMWLVFVSDGTKLTREEKLYALERYQKRVGDNPPMSVEIGNWLWLGPVPEEEDELAIKEE